MNPLRLDLGGASLLAVPSVHYRLAFADEVNRLCATEHPDAVAVELGPQTAAAAAAWLRELGMGSRSAKLPCLLGLIRPNRRIRASAREAAVRLQRLTGRDLHELPPAMLRFLLGYAPVSTLPLSPTDSIVEAMRCSLELGVPLHGVDLEETAVRAEHEILLQDPALAARGMGAYVTANAPFAEQQRDEEVDSRRELAMAARLKGLLEKHRRVVFVGGLAHWPKLQALLRSPAVRPAPPPLATQGPGLFHRVVLHPLLAVHYLDIFPRAAKRYEDLRMSPAERQTLGPSVDLDHLFRTGILREAYALRFRQDKPDDRSDRPVGDLDARSDFEQLLWNLCKLRQCSTPDIFTTFAAAHGVMSEWFCRTLARAFMGIPWAVPSDHGDVPLLAPAPSPSNQPLRAELVHSDGQRSRGFFLEALPGRCMMPGNIPIPFDWRVARPPPVERGRSGLETWVPTEDLVNAFLFRAVRVAREQGARPRVEKFEGNLLGGVDMKSTLRSAARGEDDIFVRADRRQPIASPSSDEDLDGFPVVWIFRLVSDERVEKRLSADNLGVLSAKYWPADPEAHAGAGTGTFVTAVAVLTDTHDDPTLSTLDYVVKRQTIVGKLSYWPQCCERRTAEWARETGLTRNPVCREGTYESLCEFYRAPPRGIEADEYPWHVTLVRWAIPFASRAVTVVAPDGYVLPPVVHQEAAGRRVHVRVVPLSYFPTDALRKMSEVVWLPVIRREFDEAAGIDVPVYPEHVMRHFNETLDAYRRLVPAKWH